VAGLAGGGGGRFLPLRSSLSGCSQTKTGRRKKGEGGNKTGVASGAKWNSIFDLRFFKEQLRVEV
jgi:hypothetical protein